MGLIVLDAGIVIAALDGSDVHHAAAIAALPPEMAPNVSWAAGELFGGTVDERFEFGLATLLDGLERRRQGD